MKKKISEAWKPAALYLFFGVVFLLLSFCFEGLSNMMITPSEAKFLTHGIAIIGFLLAVALVIKFVLIFVYFILKSDK